jgi:hypothetical protein
MQVSFTISRERERVCFCVSVSLAHLEAGSEWCSVALASNSQASLHQPPAPGARSRPPPAPPPGCRYDHPNQSQRRRATSPPTETCLLFNFPPMFVPSLSWQTFGFQYKTVQKREVYLRTAMTSVRGIPIVSHFVKTVGRSYAGPSLESLRTSTRTHARTHARTPLCLILGVFLVFCPESVLANDRLSRQHGARQEKSVSFSFVFSFPFFLSNLCKSVEIVSGQKPSAAAISATGQWKEPPP